MESAIIGLIGVFVGSVISGFITIRIAKKQLESAEQRADIERADKFNFAALDKKLEKHQEAFAYMYDVLNDVHGADEQTNQARVNYYKECEKWWKNNCLYLEPKSRQAFYDAFRMQSNYQTQLTAYYDNQIGREELTSDWQTMTRAKYIIESGVSKPILNMNDQEPRLEGNNN